MRLNILYEDKLLLVCEKPAGIASQSDRTIGPDMVSLLKNYLFDQNPKGGEPSLFVVHRLDRPVGGVMVYAKTHSAAAELSRQVANGRMGKKYMAVVCMAVEDTASGKVLLSDYLKKDSLSNLSLVTDVNDKCGHQAQLYYRVLAVLPDRNPPLTLLEIDLLTGRHHQIRVQLATHMQGIWGDTKYNPLFASEKGEGGNWHSIGLFAFHLNFTHPETKKMLHFEILPSHGIFSDFMPDHN